MCLSFLVPCEDCSFKSNGTSKRPTLACCLSNFYSLACNYKRGIYTRTNYRSLDKLFIKPFGILAEIQFCG